MAATFLSVTVDSVWISRRLVMAVHKVGGFEDEALSFALKATAPAKSHQAAGIALSGQSFGDQHANRREFHAAA